MTDSRVYILGKAEAEVDLAREALQGREAERRQPAKVAKLLQKHELANV